MGFIVVSKIQATASMKAGGWEKAKFQGMELFNRTLGVVGLGNIGRIVADRASGLGMRIIAADPYTSAEVAAKLEVELVSFEELVERADAITVHVPRTKETTGLLGREEFARVKKGVLIVNTARGGIVDEQALLEALESGQVGAAALDVFEQEPPPANHPLVNHEHVICTPHLGAYTEQAQVNVSVGVAEQVRDFLVDGTVRNAVNVPSISPELLEQMAPYLVLGEKLGQVVFDAARIIDHLLLILVERDAIRVSDGASRTKAVVHRPKQEELSFDRGAGLQRPYGSVNTCTRRCSRPGRRSRCTR